MPDLARKHNAIEGFCAKITELSGSPTKVIEWPDEENQGKGCCDALIVRNSKKIALDHRIVENFDNHFKDNALLNSIIAPLQTSLDGLYPGHRIRIYIRVRCLPKGSIDKMREELQNGCIKALEKTPADSRIHKYLIAGVPCEIEASKTPNKRPGCFVGRLLPKDQNSELSDEVLRALQAKSKQFGRFKENGFYTILLLDTDDFLSLDEHMIAHAFSLAIGQCNITSIDEVYLFYRYLDNFVVLPLKIGRKTYPNLKEFYQYYETQHLII